VRLLLLVAAGRDDGAVGHLDRQPERIDGESEALSSGLCLWSDVGSSANAIIYSKSVGVTCQLLVNTLGGRGFSRFFF